MTKLPDPEDDLLYQGDWLTVRAMRRRNGHLPAVEWWDGLNEKGKGQFLAAAKTIETTLRSGRPPAGRAEKVQISKLGLWELKVTKPGSTPPHLRVLYVREGQTLWAATGFTKKTNELATKDVETGDTITSEWKEER